jgi:hypothetical protein
MDLNFGVDVDSYLAFKRVNYEIFQTDQYPVDQKYYIIFSETKWMPGNATIFHSEAPLIPRFVVYFAFLFSEFFYYQGLFNNCSDWVEGFINALQGKIDASNERLKHALIIIGIVIFAGIVVHWLKKNILVNK